MAGITQEQAEAQLALYLEAEEKVLSGQSYEIAGRKLQRADLESIQAGITLWDRRVREIVARSSTGGRSRTVVVGG